MSATVTASSCPAAVMIGVLIPRLRPVTFPRNRLEPTPTSQKMAIVAAPNAVNHLGFALRHPDRKLSAHVPKEEPFTLRQLFLAPWVIQMRTILRSRQGSFFLELCGIFSDLSARPSIRVRRLLKVGSPATTTGPNRVPFISPS